MSGTDRDRVLQALGGPSPLSRQPESQRVPRTTGSWTRFQEEFEKLGGTMISSGRLLPRLKGAYVDPDAAAILGVTSPNPDLWQAELGVTTALLAICESGGLLLSAGEGRARLASLAPPHHVVLVRRDAIVASLQDALDRLPERNCVIICGPSRTADIEGVLVRGVHGPKEISVCVID